MATEVEHEHGQERDGDGEAAREHLAIDARPARGRRARSRGRGYQGEPSIEAGAAARTATGSPRQAGTMATRPPRAMMAVAIQIQPTIGLIRTSRPTESESMLWMDR